MSVKDLSIKTVQPIGWTAENKAIPEEHVNDLVQCACNMPTGLLSAHADQNGHYHNVKPYKVWIPHRDSELQNVLDIAGSWASNQCQDQTFANVKTAIVYIISEPEYLIDKSIPQNSAGKEWEAFTGVKSDDVSDSIIRRDWNKYVEFLTPFWEQEKTKRQKKQYNQGPPGLIPFHGFNNEHISSIAQTVGLAMSAVSLRSRELGYYTQFFTAYRQTLCWHDFYKGKFHSKYKWFPYIIQMIGTHPEGAKISQNRLKNKDMVNDTSALVDPNNYIKKDLPNYTHIDPNIKILEPKEYRSLVKSHPRSIPTSQFRYFMKHFGKYSTDPKKLFCDSYGNRIKDPEGVFANLMDE